MEAGTTQRRRRLPNQSWITNFWATKSKNSWTVKSKRRLRLYTTQSTPTTSMICNRLPSEKFTRKFALTKDIPSKSTTGSVLRMTEASALDLICRQWQVIIKNQWVLVHSISISRGQYRLGVDHLNRTEAREATTMSLSLAILAASKPHKWTTLPSLVDRQVAEGIIASHRLDHHEIKSMEETSSIPVKPTGTHINRWWSQASLKDQPSTTTNHTTLKNKKIKN